ncbi:MAG: polyprenyl synthetase family protein, partial [Nanoarchaeota archaeon]
MDSSLSYYLQEFRPRIDGALGIILERYCARCNEDDATRRIYDRLVAFTLRPGKRIRPLLAIIAYNGYVQGEPAPAIIEAAAALELLHTFMLVHDDINDKAVVRRGSPALHKELGHSGNDLAIIAGDLAYTIALQTFTSLDAPASVTVRLLGRILAITHDTGVGQLKDIENATEPLPLLKEEDVLRADLLKTARYGFEAPLQVGAILCGVHDEELDRIAKVALPLGEAFQLKDDLDDLAGGTLEKSLPVVHAYHHGDQDDKSVILSALENGSSD